MDCSQFWKDLRKEKARWDSLTPTEQLKERIDEEIKSLKALGAQPVRDEHGRFLGHLYVLADYNIEKILSILEDVRRVI